MHEKWTEEDAYSEKREVLANGGKRKKRNGKEDMSS